MKLDLKKLVEGLGHGKTGDDVGDPMGRRAFAAEMVYEDDKLAPDEKTGIRSPFARKGAEDRTRQAQQSAQQDAQRTQDKSRDSQILRRGGWVDMGGEGEYAGEYWAHPKLTKGRPVSMSDALAQAAGGSIRARNEGALRSFVRGLVSEADFGEDPLGDSISLDVKIERLRKKIEAAKSEIYPDMEPAKRAATTMAISNMQTRLRDLRSQRVASWVSDERRARLGEGLDEKVEWDDELHAARAWADDPEAAAAASYNKKTGKWPSEGGRTPQRKQRRHKKPSGDER